MWRTCEPKCWTFIWLIELYLVIVQNPVWIINKFKVLIISNQLFGLIVVLLLKLGSYIWRIQHYLTILQDGTMLSYLGLLLNLYVLLFFWLCFRQRWGYIFLRECSQHDSLLLEFISFCMPIPDFSLVRQNCVWFLSCIVDRPDGCSLTEEGFPSSRIRTRVQLISASVSNPGPRISGRLWWRLVPLCASALGFSACPRD